MYGLSGWAAKRFRTSSLEGCRAAGLSGCSWIGGFRRDSTGGGGATVVVVGCTTGVGTGCGAGTAGATPIAARGSLSRGVTFVAFGYHSTIASLRWREAKALAPSARAVATATRTRS